MTVDKGDVVFATIPAQEILAQTERILAHKSFAHSTVFKRFLRFIVQESLGDRTNKLKEYTIAREVLDKPENFNTQEDCIVRVHAMRLRKALDLYYEETRLNPGQVRISIPKGQYAPIFSRILDTEGRGKKLPGTQVRDHYEETPRMPSFYIAPFRYAGRNGALREFAEGLGIELGCTLGSFEWCTLYSSSVVPEAMKVEAEEQPTFTISGELRCQVNRVRVSIELARNADRVHVWGGIFEYPWPTDSSFRLEDELVAVIIDKVTSYTREGAGWCKPGKLVAIT